LTKIYYNGLGTGKVLREAGRSWDFVGNAIIVSVIDSSSEGDMGLRSMHLDQLMKSDPFLKGEASISLLNLHLLTRVPPFPTGASHR
jgi:hypothetical protein